MAGEDADREKQQAARSLPYAEMEHAASSSNLTPRTNFEKMGMLLKIAVPGSEKKIALLVAGIIGEMTKRFCRSMNRRLAFTSPDVWFSWRVLATIPGLALH